MSATLKTPAQAITVPVESEVTDPTRTKAWDDFVQTEPDSSFFHTGAWASVLKDTYAYQPIYMMIHSGGERRAAWPVIEVNSRFTGRRGVSLPFTDECRPLIGRGVSSDEALAAVIEFGRRRQWRYFEFRGGEDLFPGLRNSVRFWAHVIRLSGDGNRQRSRCSGATGRAISKAIRSGVQAGVSDQQEAVRDFYSLHCRTRKRHGLPPQPYAFFGNLYRHVIAHGNGFVVTARYRERLIAAAVYLRHGPSAIYKFGASDEAYHHLRGNNLIMWTAIEHCISEGCDTLCLGRTSRGNQGLRRYKLGWGAEERELGYFRYDLRRNEFIRSSDQALGWHNLVFRLCPVAISRGLGAILYRHWG